MADLYIFFKAILEQDLSPIVVCNLEHTVIYMNPSAVTKYKCNITGKSIFDCHSKVSNELIKKVVEWFKTDKSNCRIYTYRNDEQNKDVYMIALRDEKQNLIGYYEKHEFRSPETARLYDFN